MSIPFKRITWNEYEIALLVNLYDLVQSGNVSRAVAIRKMSARLRGQLIRNGIDVNDKYRNVAGISLQLYSIDRYIKGKDSECQAISKTFEKIINLRANDIESYKRLLCESNIMYPEIIEGEKIEINLVSSEPYANEKKIVVDFKIREILQNNFANGYRIESNMDYKRFANAYTAIYNEALTLDNVDLCNTISSICINYKGKLYTIESLANSEVKEKLFSYIESKFDSGVKYIYYSKLYEYFNDEFLCCRIYDYSILKLYLKHCNDKNEYVFFDKYFSKEHIAYVDENSLVIDYIKEQGRSVSLKETLSTLSFLPEDIVRKSFANNKDILLVSGREERFHIDNFQLEYNDKQIVINYLIQEINNVKFVSFKELIDKMSILTPRIIDNNAQFTDTGIRSALSLLLKENFNFRGGIISNLIAPISMQDVFIDFSRGRDSFSMNEVQLMSDEFNTLINFEALLVNNIRVSENLYVAKNNITLCIDDIDRAIEKYCRSEFISVSEIDTYVIFPECEYTWNEYLLESYLYFFSKTFKLLHNRFNKTTVSGVIVRKNSRFTNYSDVLVAALSSSPISLDNESNVLNYLCKNGFLGRRQLDGIEQIITRAKQLKRN